MSSKCQKICEIIGKREAKNVELSKREFNLRRRLEMLECWLPAVTMMRLMTGDVKSADISDLIEKQTADMTVSCLCPNARLSRHEDVRIREIESERKKAEEMLNGARLLLSEKETAVLEQLRKIEDARKNRQELESKIKELEAKISSYSNLNEAVSQQSLESIGPDELLYLTKLEELVTTEAASRKQLEELEKRQEGYMKALEAAGEIWHREEPTHEVNGLRSQLEVKSSANQQLAGKICQLEDQVESLKGKLSACNEKLSQLTRIEISDVKIGTDQSYRDKELSIKPELREVSVTQDYRIFQNDEEINATVDVKNEEASAIVEVTERAVQETAIAPLEQRDEGTGTEHEPQIVSVQGSVWPGELSQTQPLNYDNYEAELTSRITKFDVSTTMSVNFILIDISDLEIWRKYLNNIDSVISECDTCKSTKPGVLMIQEAINRQLGMEFVERDDESFPVIPVRPVTVGLIETVDEYQVLEPLEQVSEGIGFDGNKGSIDKIAPGGAIYEGSETAGHLTPHASVKSSVEMSTPIRGESSSTTSEHRSKTSQIEKGVENELIETSGKHQDFGSQEEISETILLDVNKGSSDKIVPDTGGDGEHETGHLTLSTSLQNPVATSTPIRKKSSNTMSKRGSKTSLIQTVLEDGLIEASSEHQNSNPTEEVPDTIPLDIKKKSNDNTVAGGGVDGGLEVGHLTSSTSLEHPVVMSSSTVEKSASITSNHNNKNNVLSEEEGKQMISMKDVSESMALNPSNLNDVENELKNVENNEEIKVNENENIDAVEEKDSMNTTGNEGIRVNKDEKLQNIEEEEMKDDSVEGNEMRVDNQVSQNIRETGEILQLDEGRIAEAVGDRGGDGKEEDEGDEENEKEIVEENRIGASGEGDEDEAKDIRVDEIEETKGTKVEDVGASESKLIDSRRRGSKIEEMVIEQQRRTFGEFGRSNPQEKCPVMSKMSFCICHALRGWPRMTRKEYRKSKEAIGKISSSPQQSHSFHGSKTVSIATVRSILTQTNVERPSVISDKPRPPILEDSNDESSGHTCDSCECDPCVSASISSSLDAESYEARRSVEKRDQEVMVKIYKSRR